MHLPSSFFFFFFLGGNEKEAGPDIFKLEWLYEPPFRWVWSTTVSYTVPRMEPQSGLKLVVEVVMFRYRDTFLGFFVIHVHNGSNRLWSSLVLP